MRWNYFDRSDNFKHQSICTSTVMKIVEWDGTIEKDYDRSHGNERKTLHQGYAGNRGNHCRLIACGKSISDILAEYPYLERNDVTEAFSYAAWRSEERENLRWRPDETVARFEFTI